jgi:hypothetical protein
MTAFGGKAAVGGSSGHILISVTWPLDAPSEGTVREPIDRLIARG